MLTRGQKTAFILCITILYLLATANLFTMFRMIRESHEVNEKVEILSTYYNCECEYCECGKQDK